MVSQFFFLHFASQFNYASLGDFMAVEALKALVFEDDEMRQNK